VSRSGRWGRRSLKRFTTGVTARHGEPIHCHIQRRSRRLSPVGPDCFQQVEDALAEVRILSDQIKRQQEAVNYAERYLKLEQTRYDTGIDPYIDLAVAQTTSYSSQQTLADLQIQQMSASVTLIQALGGGWDRTNCRHRHRLPKSPRLPTQRSNTKQALKSGWRAARLKCASPAA